MELNPLQHRKREKGYADAWLEAYHTTISIEDLVTVAIQGHTTCNEKEWCFSRSNSGDGACRCIRAVFPSQEHLALYEELRLLVCAIELFDELSKGEVCAD